MKKLEFETSKGRFLVVDMVIDIWTSEDEKSSTLHLEGEVYQVMSCIKLAEITEEQASDIVDKVMNEQHFQNYNFKSYNDRWVKTAIESLHSLLKSKGLHLFKNPLQSSKPTADLAFYDNVKDAKLIYNKWKESEQKTFYNPYIFKLCTKQQS